MFPNLKDGLDDEYDGGCHNHKSYQYHEVFIGYTGQSRGSVTNYLMVRMNCYEPGQVTLMHMHPEEDEILYIAGGEGIVTFKDRVDFLVKAGELVYPPSDQC
jgi:quercetin dioxygenase-like cupin family protein